MIVPAAQRAGNVHLNLAAARASCLRAVVRRTRASSYALELDLDLDYIAGRVHDLAAGLNSDGIMGPGRDLDLDRARQLAEELTGSVGLLHAQARCLARSDVRAQEIAHGLDVACLLASACGNALARAAAKLAGPPAAKGTRAFPSALRLAVAAARLLSRRARARYREEHRVSSGSSGATAPEG